MITMKNIIAILGTNADYSHNRMVLTFMKEHFSEQASIEVIEISEFPMFKVSKNTETPKSILALSEKIEQSDGVIFATPEYDHTITAALKSVIEWLSFQVHPLEKKPVMIVGASYGVQGTVRAQSHLREILDSPGVNAHVLFGNEFMLGNAKDKFDYEKGLTCVKSTDFLEQCFKNFLDFVNLHVID